MDTEVEAATEARARELARRGGRIGRLTARELDVARLVALGLDNKEIAALLTVATRTVETHLRSVFAKLDVDRRAAVAFLLARTLFAARREA